MYSTNTPLRVFINVGGYCPLIPCIEQEREALAGIWSLSCEPCSSHFPIDGERKRPMYYSIASPIYLAEIENDVILLNAAAQRYKLLSWVKKKQFSPSCFFTEPLADTPVPQKLYQEALETCLKAGGICEGTSDGDTKAPLILPRRWPSWLSLRLEALMLLHQINGIIRRQQFLPLIQALMDSQHFWPPFFPLSKRGITLFTKLLSGKEETREVLEIVSRPHY